MLEELEIVGVEGLVLQGGWSICLEFMHMCKHLIEYVEGGLSEDVLYLVEVLGDLLIDALEDLGVVEFLGEEDLDLLRADAETQESE